MRDGAGATTDKQPKLKMLVTPLPTFTVSMPS